MTEAEENQIIETVTEDGEVVQFHLFDIVEFEGKEYALLLPVEDEDEEDPEIVLMKLTKEEDDYVFETIEDDEEFDRVSEYIENLESETEE